ncbi:Phospholipase/carboxylesterase/thioesterase [Scleroderma yunnanense]
MAQESNPPLIVPAEQTHTATVIFVHGLGDTGYGWKPVADMLSRAMPHVKWILPHAPQQPITANFGMTMPAWFDIQDFTFKSAEDEKGMLTSVGNLNDIIRKEVDSGVPPSRIVLGGFSQGGVMSLLCGLTSERKLGGVVVLSAWLPLRQKFKVMMSDHARSLPIFWGHGTADPLVRYEFATMSIEYLVKHCGLTRLRRDEIGKPGLTFVEYPGMEHSSCPQEFTDLGEFLKRAVPALE